jgi:cell division protein FtsN
MAAPAPIPAEPAKVAKPKAKQDKPAAPAKATPESRYYVNVGLFADANNALNTFVKLTDAGLAATKQEFNTSKGKRTRVRLGPFDTEGQAISAIEKVRALGLEAIIVRPEKP